MDIFDLDGSLNDDGSRRLEDLLLEALRLKLADLWQSIVAADAERLQLLEKFNETHEPEDLEALRAQTDQWSWECEDRQDVMRILGAIVMGSDEVIDSKTILGILNKRFSNGASVQWPVPPPGRAGSQGRRGRPNVTAKAFAQKILSELLSGDIDRDQLENLAPNKDLMPRYGIASHETAKKARELALAEFDRGRAAEIRGNSVVEFPRPKTDDGSAA